MNCCHLGIQKNTAIRHVTHLVGACTPTVSEALGWILLEYVFRQFYIIFGRSNQILTFEPQSWQIFFQRQLYPCNPDLFFVIMQVFQTFFIIKQIFSDLLSLFQVLLPFLSLLLLHSSSDRQILVVFPMGIVQPISRNVSNIDAKTPLTGAETKIWPNACSGGDLLRK